MEIVLDTKRRAKGNTMQRKPNIKSKVKKLKEKNKIRERSRDESKERTKIAKLNLDKIFKKNKSLYANKGLTTIITTDSGILSKYEEINKQQIYMKYEGNVEELNRLMEINGKRTNKDKAIKLGEQLYYLISNMKKT